MVASYHTPSSVRTPHMALSSIRVNPSAMGRPMHRCFPPSAKPAARSAISATAKEFLEDCSKLPGRLRFIVVGEGAILETVSSFQKGVKYTTIPNKGELATISTDSKEFELHIFVDKLKEVKLVKSKAKTGDHPIYATRLQDGQGKGLVSILLHQEHQEGEGAGRDYPADAVAAWQKLLKKYGESALLE